jgi:cephalosporin hydroxylase
VKTVRQCFYAHQGRYLDKWDHYFDIYERYFAQYVGKPVRVLEIGVSHGGSLQLWKSYFGPQARIVGIDIDPKCREYVEDQIDIRIFDQANPAIAGLGTFDIVIDDGSHRKSDQEASFKALWPSTRGVFIVEDCHHTYPDITATDGFLVPYPWVLVALRPRRLIRGIPSRELTEAEREAVSLYSNV